MMLAAVAGWQSAYAPTEKEKNECREAAQKTGFKTEECKTFWERTTSDPIAFFTLVLGFSTVGLWVATIALYRAGERQIRVSEKSATVAERALVELEAPFLSIGISESGLTKKSGERGHDFKILKFCVFNYGRTPARLIEIVDKTWLVDVNGRISAYN